MSTTRHHQLDQIVIANWGLVGSNSPNSTPPYRSQNPWQVLESYMERKRGDAEDFFRKHGAVAVRIDRGGSVWRVELERVPTPGGLALDEFAHKLLERLVQNFDAESGDHLFVTYASESGFGHLEWTP